MTERRAAHNSTYPKGGVSFSKDSFVVNGKLVFQIKFCGQNPALRVAVSATNTVLEKTFATNTMNCYIFSK
jgi:hypothetical protein